MYVGTSNSDVISLFWLKELEKIASRKLRINAKETMKIAEKLYSQGCISYPRTETNIFPKEFDLVSLVQKQAGDARWGGQCSVVLHHSPLLVPCSGKVLMF